MTSPAGLPGFPGLRLVEDLGTVQRYEAVDGAGLPVSVLVLGEHAARDPRQRAAFAEHAVQAAVAAVPGELPITVDAEAPRPWAASHREPDGVGVERLLPRVLAATAPPLLAQPQFAAPGWAGPVPGPPQPPPSSRVPLVVGLVSVVVMLLLGLVAAVALRSVVDSVAAPDPVEPLPTLPELPPPPSFGLPPELPRLEGPRPTLKDVPPVTVLGPSFGPDDETYTFDFDGWPFAFRAPLSWGCLLATVPIPDSYGYGCIDEQNPGDGQRMTVMIRRCPTTCTSAEQDEMNRAWLDEPERAVVFDPTTVYVETERTERGTYSVDFSHFFATAPAEPLSWQVGVYVESPPETRDEVLKILNEIRSQTP